MTDAAVALLIALCDRGAVRESERVDAEASAELTRIGFAEIVFGGGRSLLRATFDGRKQRIAWRDRAREMLRGE